MTSKDNPRADARIRVLWVIKGLGPGGAERLLCAAARAHDRNRFHLECAFVLPYKDQLADELERAQVKTHCMGRTRTDRYWPRRLTRLVRDGGWDVVHVHSPLPGAVARLATRTIPRAKRPCLVTTEHNRWATHRAPTRWLNRLTSRWDDVSFAVTDEVRESMSGPVRRRAETLQHGIDVEETAKQSAHRDDVRAELGIAVDEVLVGTVANFRPQKDYPNLLQAARLLADRDVSVRFVAVGQGPQEAEIRKLQHQLGLDGRMILTGFRDDAVRVMAACDIFTLASKWEGLPVALMEALALGLPVVATAVGGVAEQLVDGESALLVPPGDPTALADAIGRVVSDHDVRCSLACASTGRASDFDVRNAVTRIESVYAEFAPEPLAEQTKPVVLPTRQCIPKGLSIREATPADRSEIIELCRVSLGWGDDPRFEQLFSWKHDENAFGPSYMWVAMNGSKIVGLRAFMRWEFVRGGEVLRTVRAVDTATHPEYQGKGLFTSMTLKAIDEVRADGVDFVFNTPNEKSRPGYLKMGWQVVGRIPVSVKVTRLGGAWRSASSWVASRHWPEPLEVGKPISSVVDQLDLNVVDGSADRRRLSTRMSSEFLTWRYGAEFLGYRFVPQGDGGVVVRLRHRGLAKELVLLASLGLEESAVAKVVALIAAETGADHVVWLGRPDVRRGFISLPGGGPVMTWRSVNTESMPPLANWQLTMGDVELF
jgi:glycosyltransferase involved in cell wall biosynthesis/GNAT superfamily N-acetyltransferase